MYKPHFHKSTDSGAEEGLTGEGKEGNDEQRRRGGVTEKERSANQQSSVDGLSAETSET